MKITKTFEEFLEAYKADNEFPLIDLENDNDEALVNVLAQIYLGIFDGSSHYKELTAQLLHVTGPIHNPAIDITSALYEQVLSQVNRIIRLCQRVKFSLTEEMILYYASKTCEELGIGDMKAGGDNSDDLFIVAMYNRTKTQAMIHGLYQWSDEARMVWIDNKIAELIGEKDKISTEIDTLIKEKQAIVGKTSTISGKN